MTPLDDIHALPPVRRYLVAGVYALTGWALIAACWTLPAIIYAILTT